MNLDVMRYIYRREFKLTAAELEEEPADQFFLNMAIYALIKKKEQAIAKDASRS